MKTNNKSVLGIHNCFGCGVCATVCAKGVISIKLNTEGFYEPFIEHQDECIDCGLCRQVCSYLADENVNESSVIGAYSVWSNEQSIRFNCSSGGAAFELERKAIEDGFKVCVCRYNTKEARVEHYVASSEEELYPSIGSKYLQSLTTCGFEKIDFKGKYLIVGTPCQIDSFRRFIRLKKCEENFTLIDFYCHGVPSQYLWHRYLDRIKRLTGEVIDVSWRNKNGGWHDSYAVCVAGDDNSNINEDCALPGVINPGQKYKTISKFPEGDVFFSFFLGNFCLSRACYDKCRFKKYSSSADIRVGDMWGKKFMNCEEGVSAVLTFTQKGNATVMNLDRCCINSEKPDCVSEGQMINRIHKPWYRGLIIRLFKIKSVPLGLTLLIGKALRRIDFCFHRQ